MEQVVRLLESASVSQKAPQPQSSTMIIFGASGDLTERKLIPALYELHCNGALPDGFCIVGSSRTRFSDAEFRAAMRKAAEEHGDVAVTVDGWEPFAERLFYSPADVTNIGDFEALDDFVRQLRAHRSGDDNRVYYLAIAPQFFDDTVKHLGETGMPREDGGWRRIVVEKPFGRDLESARDLNSLLHSTFDEEQIYRIDHYLGKETVQNLMVFRFANAIFEPVWNRNFIDHVQITVAESVGVGDRAGYYDTAGVLRDMFQNHLMQLLTLTALEPPVAFEAGALRDEKVKVLRAVRPILPADVGRYTVRGQYDRGDSAGEAAVAYREEDNVPSDSQTATFAVLQFLIDNWRWDGVPFYLRSGKRLAAKSTEIVIQFKRPPHLLFKTKPAADLPPNLLAICIQPDEGMHLRFETKVPGAGMAMQSVDMEFHYRAAFGGSPLPTAYERLLLDILQGDPTLFARADEIELAWSLIDQIIDGWHSDAAPELNRYESGSWGPEAAHEFIRSHGRVWREACEHGDSD
jgi:glucose-6-phosphate 1-dehydrogenase